MVRRSVLYRYNLKNVFFSLLAVSLVSIVAFRSLSLRQIGVVKSLAQEKQRNAEILRANIAQTKELDEINFWFRPEILLKNATNLDKKLDSGLDNLPQIHAQAAEDANQPNLVNEAAKESKPILRCRVHHVGCFQNRYTPPFFVDQINVNLPDLTADACVQKCLENEKPYAAVDPQGKCRCGVQIATATLLTYPDQCDMKCPGDGSQLCGGNWRVQVYHVNTPCHKGPPTPDDVAKSTIGCYATSYELKKAFTIEHVSEDGEVSSCVSYCEEQAMTVASWDNLGVCRCGKFTETFSPQNLGNPLDISVCENDSCPPGTVICYTKYIRLIRTNVEDARCSDRRFLNPVIGRLVALISFPGSGNTWVRHLIESATGIYSGSVYNDRELYQNGFLGELQAWNSKRTCVIKTHEMTAQDAAKFDEAIFVIRDPYQAITAEFNRLKGGNHVGYASEQMFKSEEWHHFVSYKIEKWFTTCKSYVTVKKVLVVFFEDIVANPIKEVRKMVSFLRYTVKNLESRIACLREDTGGSFHRAKRKLTFDPFPEDLKTLVNSRIRLARKVLQEKGLPAIPKYERYQF